MALSTAAGKRDKRIAFERKSVTTDAFGGEVEMWAEIARAWASVSFGTGQERRTAAQEGAALTATFRVLRNSLTASLTPLDRIIFMGAAWDIQGPPVPTPENDGFDLTAARAA